MTNASLAGPTPGSLAVQVGGGTGSASAPVPPGTTSPLATIGGGTAVQAPYDCDFNWKNQIAFNGQPAVPGGIYSAAPGPNYYMPDIPYGSTVITNPNGTYTVTTPSGNIVTTVNSTSNYSFNESSGTYSATGLPAPSTANLLSASSSSARYRRTIQPTRG